MQRPESLLKFRVEGGGGHGAPVHSRFAAYSAQLQIPIHQFFPSTYLLII